MDVNISNRFMVGVRGDAIAIMMSQAVLTKAEAINLAAWLVALADDGETFKATLEAIQS